MPGGSVEFYGVMAQVVPVLVLVVLLEQRAHRKVVGPVTELVVVLSAVLAAALAEIVALLEVYRGSSAASDQYWVIVPVAWLAFVIVAPVVVTAAEDALSAGGRRSRAFVWGALIFVAWAISVIAFVATKF